MPKLYEYLGLIILFYSKDHEPIHVHGKYQELESKTEILFESVYSGQSEPLNPVQSEPVIPAQSEPPIWV